MFLINFVCADPKNSRSKVVASRKELVELLILQASALSVDDGTNPIRGTFFSWEEI